MKYKRGRPTNVTTNCVLSTTAPIKFANTGNRRESLRGTFKLRGTAVQKFITPLYRKLVEDDQHSQPRVG